MNHVVIYTPTPPLSLSCFCLSFSGYFLVSECQNRNDINLIVKNLCLLSVSRTNGKDAMMMVYQLSSIHTSEPPCCACYVGRCGPSSNKMAL